MQMFGAELRIGMMKNKHIPLGGFGPELLLRAAVGRGAGNHSNSGIKRRWEWAARSDDDLADSR
jgi:hypothetical protein